MKRQLLTLAISCLLFAPVRALAIAATEEEILCHSSAVVVAEVLGVKSRDCRRDVKEGEYCSPNNLVELSVQIKRVLGIRTFPVYQVETISLAVSMRNGLLFGKPLQDGNGYLAVIPPTNSALSDDQLEKYFLGKSFIFAYSVDARGASPYWASAYRLTSENWVINQIEKDPTCPKPSHDTAAP